MNSNVYILLSLKHEKFYTVVSSNISKRIESHNLGLNKSTKNGIPWKLIWTSPAMERGESLKLERRIKKRGAKRFLSDINFDLNPGLRD
ncbi:MAG TPA: excinuclease ABC subunit C [Flavobacteriales bacterium]|jgi:putative endonuclease|nr:excinuclease ABC subunit C [Flavobacteriales bacterium]